MGSAATWRGARLPEDKEILRKSGIFLRPGDRSAPSETQRHPSTTRRGRTSGVSMCA
jgi:hypothetical protein